MQQATLRCPKCHDAMVGDLSPAISLVASGYDSCLRRCDTCGIGASNATNAESVTYIHRNPLDNIPEQIWEGADIALSKALNVQNRKSKRVRFGFSTSEDALTWVVFAYLLRSRQLVRALRHVGIVKAQVDDATLLLWGTPIDNSERGADLRMRLQSICRALKEDTQSFSEPDVIVDLGDAGLIFIEVKYRSGNDTKPYDYPGWDRYFPNAELPWDEAKVRASGCYELARNWRFLGALAGGRPTILVNLGPARLFSGSEGERLDGFVAALGMSPHSLFQKVTWADLLSGLETAPNWLTEWLTEFCRGRYIEWPT